MSTVLNIGHVSWQKNILCPEILLLVGVLLPLVLLVSNQSDLDLSVMGEVERVLQED